MIDKGQVQGVLNLMSMGEATIDAIMNKDRFDEAMRAIVARLPGILSWSPCDGSELTRRVRIEYMVVGQQGPESTGEIRLEFGQFSTTVNKAVERALFLMHMNGGGVSPGLRLHAKMTVREAFNDSNSGVSAFANNSTTGACFLSHLLPEFTWAEDPHPYPFPEPPVSLGVGVSALIGCIRFPMADGSFEFRPLYIIEGAIENMMTLGELSNLLTSRGMMGDLLSDPTGFAIVNTRGLIISRANDLIRIDRAPHNKPPIRRHAPESQHEKVRD